VTAIREIAAPVDRSNGQVAEPTLPRTGNAVRRLLERIGNPLEWRDIDKALIIQSIVGPPMLLSVFRARYILAHPEIEPYYDRPTLDWMIWLIGVFLLVTAGLIATGMVLRRREGRHRLYLHAVVQSWWLTYAALAYLHGLATSPLWTVLPCLGFICLLLFDARLATPGFVTSVVVLYATTVAERLGVIPYAPLLPRGPFIGDRVADEWLWSSMIWPVVVSAIGFLMFAFILERGRRHARQVVEMKEAAEEASRSKGAFLATVSHELRTPLTSILGFAKLIKKRLAEVVTPAVAGAEPRVQRAIGQIASNIDIIVAEGERLTALINNVLDLAKIEAGRVEWKVGPVAIAEVVARAIAATMSLGEQKGLSLRAEIEDRLPPVQGDRDRLIQVMINLISNAVKFTERGAITCRARRAGREIVVTVADTGMGIAPENQAKVFEEFAQVGDTLTDKPTGTGLGLPICKHIVEHFGGRIWVESDAGKGSAFFFTLPLGDDAHAGDASEELEAPTFRRDTLIAQLKAREVEGPAGRSILVVDDDPSIREFLRQDLEAEGYAVREARDGAEALAALRAARPDLVLLDIMMPGLNGFDVAAVIRNDPALFDLPIFVVSVVQDQQRGCRLGVDRYFIKPVDGRALVEEIHARVARGTMHRRVLVVDEDAATVGALVSGFEARGYQVTAAYSSEEAVAKAVDGKPDLVVAGAVVSKKSDLLRTLRFEKGLDRAYFVLFD
jgi:signal transduction histidine kinase/DNA-binding response OmpR family regulator